MSEHEPGDQATGNPEVPAHSLDYGSHDPPADFTPSPPQHVNEASRRNRTQSNPFNRRSLRNIMPALVATLVLVHIPSTAQVDRQPICDSPTSEDIQAVEDLLAEPADPYNRIRMDKGWEAQQASGFRGQHTEKALVDINAHAADEHGLTTHNYLEYKRPLHEDIFNPDSNTLSLPFATYFEQAQKFAELYGIELVEYDPDFTFGDPTDRPPTEFELESPTAKTNMYRLIENLGLLPVELVHYAGLKKIIMMYSEREVGGYVTSTQPGTYIINIRPQLSRQVFAHEFYHLIDWRHCGDAELRDDKDFSELNGKPIYKHEGIDPADVITDEDHKDFYQKNFHKIVNARKQNDQKAYCQLIKEAEALKEASTSPTEYGLTDTAEDKAEIFSEMLDTQLQEGETFIDEGSPLIRKKSVFLLARLYKGAQNTVRYLIQVNAPLYGEGDSVKPKATDC